MHIFREPRSSISLPLSRTVSVSCESCWLHEHDEGTKDRALQQDEQPPGGQNVQRNQGRNIQTIIESQTMLFPFVQPIFIYVSLIWGFF